MDVEDALYLHCIAESCGTECVSVADAFFATDWFAAFCSQLEPPSNEYSTWTTLQDGNAISSGGTETYAVSSAQTHGTTVYFQVRSGASNPSSGSYTAATAVTVDCPVIDVSGSQALSGSCSGGAET